MHAMWYIPKDMLTVLNLSCFVGVNLSVSRNSYNLFTHIPQGYIIDTGAMGALEVFGWLYYRMTAPVPLNNREGGWVKSTGI